MLLEARAAVDATNKQGETALLWAARNSEEGVVRLLLKVGAAVGAANNHGRTALMEAACVGSGLMVVRMLLKAGAAVDARDNDGYTALMRATEAGHEGTMSLLQEAEAVINECVDNQMTRFAQNALSAKEDEEVERLREEISRMRTNFAAALSAKEDEMRRLTANIINRLRNANAALTGGIAEVTRAADM
mmetsp:Transcript_30718/g.51727  ORF Transcript_30718/g.51727 Transcript_30718/m.51727 type:complete len:190 (-) Transcript_30718:71-640(-)